MSTTHPGRAVTVSERIATAIRERIVSGDLKPGDRIPSETEIVGEYGVAKATAQKVAARLRSEGLVETRAGVGGIVRERRAGVSPAAQFARMADTGRIRAASERTVVQQTGTLSADRVDPHIVAAIDATEQSGPLVYRRRLIYRDGAPMCLATSWWPPTLTPLRGWAELRDRLLSYDLVPGGTPRLVCDLVGEDLEREDYTAHAAAASAAEASDLGLQPGAPLLRVVTVAHTASWAVEAGAYTYPAGMTIGFPSAEHRA